jgi:hypothetical protein
MPGPRLLQGEERSGGVEQGDGGGEGGETGAVLVELVSDLGDVDDREACSDRGDGDQYGELGPIPDGDREGEGDEHCDGDEARCFEVESEDAFVGVLVGLCVVRLGVLAGFAVPGFVGVLLGALGRGYPSLPFCGCVSAGWVGVRDAGIG